MKRWRTVKRQRLMLEDGDRKGPRIDGRRDSEEKDRKRWVGERCGDIAHDMLSIDVYYVFFCFENDFGNEDISVYIYILWNGLGLCFTRTPLRLFLLINLYFCFYWLVSWNWRGKNCSLVRVYRLRLVNYLNALNLYTGLKTIPVVLNSQNRFNL